MLTGRPAAAVRKGDYKLVQMYERGKAELYNLKDDISEQNDLSSVFPGKVAELYRLLVYWRKDVKAEMPVNYVPVKY
ncbi:MAG: hypothetical protein MUE32_11285 [Bacteroidales bacterium]|nr:hypothetical protein [Bacteroidales bacterium]